MEKTPREIVDAYFAAMRRGAAAEDEIIALFTEDAVYEEPFTGESGGAVGRTAIRERLRTGWTSPLPDMTVEVLSMTVTPDQATARWRCTSPALPGGVATGTDRYRFRDGRIAHLRVKLDRPPPPE